MDKYWSKYNRLIDRCGVFLLYNSLSNSFIELDKELYNYLSTFSPGDPINTPDDELIELLNKTRSIVRSDIHEFNKLKYITQRYRFDDSHLVLTINPTLQCNFSCPYCFEQSHKGKTMNEEVENKILEFIKKIDNLKSIGITWFGGEPLLAFDRVESMSKKLLELNIPYNAGMITNGYLINESIAKRMSLIQIGYVQITIDGLADRHNSRRPLSNGGPTFDRIMQSINTLIDYAPQIRVNIRVNVDNDNSNEFVELYFFLTRTFGNKINIYPAFTSDATGTGYGCVCSKRERKDFFQNLLIKHSLDFSAFYPLGERLECSVRNSSSLIIGPEGELYSCWNEIGNPSKVYGTIDGGITNEIELLKYKIEADPFDNEDCKSCLLLPVCNGGCPYERIKRKERGESPNDCPLMKNELDDYLWWHYVSKTGFDKKSHNHLVEFS